NNSLLRQTHANLKKATDELRETTVSRTFLDAALNNMSQGLCMFDSMQNLIVCNPQFSSVIGLKPGVAAPGTSFRAIIDAAERHGSADAAHLLAMHHCRIEGNMPASDFEVLPGERSISVSHQPMQDGGWVATFEDVTERKRIEARIAHMAKHDALTG